MKKSLNLNAILVQDKSGGYTSFFAQFPNIIAEGDTEDQAIENLFNLVQDVFEHQQKEEMQMANGNESIKTRSFNLAMA